MARWPRQCLSHFLNVAEPHADTWTSKFDSESDFTLFHAMGYVVRLNFFRAPALHAGGFVSGPRI